MNQVRYVENINKDSKKRKITEGGVKVDQNSCNVHSQGSPFILHVMYDIHIVTYSRCGVEWIAKSRKNIERKQKILINKNKMAIVKIGNKLNHMVHEKFKYVGIMVYLCGYSFISLFR